MKKKKFGFSLMEIIVSFITVALIAAVCTPILFKKNSKMKLKGLNSITSKCDSNNPTCSSFGNRCRLFKKTIANGVVTYTCLICNNNIIGESNRGSKYFDRKTCSFKFCSEFDSKVTPSCVGCCVRCNSTYCTGCAQGVGLEDKNAQMGCKICQEGYYSDNSNGVTEACKICPAGYYCPQRSTNPTPCPVGYYCPEGSSAPTLCPEGCYCPEEKMGSLSEHTGVPGLSCPVTTARIINKTFPCEAGCYCPSGMGVLKPMDAAAMGRTMSCPSSSFDGSTFACPKNYYCPAGRKPSDVAGSTAYYCPNVIKHTVTKHPGAPNSSFCVCDAGFEYKDGQCKKCPPGTTKIEIGNEFICKDCPEGTICPEPDAKPTYCGCGERPDKKRKECIVCKAATPVSGKKSDVCIGCSGNQIPGEKKCKCVDCPEGQVPDKDNLKCIGCGERYPGCKTCDKEGKCKECKCGYRLKDNKTCAKCGAGTFSKAGATECTVCIGNSISTAEGACSCKDCKDKEYADGQHKACYPCKDKFGPHCTSCNKDACTGCASGWTTKLNFNKINDTCCRRVTAGDCPYYNGSNMVYFNNMCINDNNRGGGTTKAAHYYPGTASWKANLCPSPNDACCWNVAEVIVNKKSNYDEYWTHTSVPGECSPKDPDDIWGGYTACHRTVCNGLVAKKMCDVESGKGHILRIADLGPTDPKLGLRNITGFYKLRFCSTLPYTGLRRCNDISIGPAYENAPEDKKLYYCSYADADGKIQNLCSLATVYFGNKAGDEPSNPRTNIDGKFYEIGNRPAGSIRCVRDFVCDDLNGINKLDYENPPMR